MLDDLLNVMRNTAKIALIDIRIDVVDRFDIVVIDNDRRLITPKRRHIAEDLCRVALRRRNRRP